MHTHLNECKLLPIPPTQLEEVKDNAVDYALSHGICMGKTVVDADGVSHHNTIHAPFTLFPSAVPSGSFAKAVSLTDAYNKLMARVATDPKWVADALGEVLAADDFTNNLYATYQAFLEADETKVSPLALGLFRHDYMLHFEDGNEPQTKMLNIECNAIASAFPALGGATADMHAFLSSRYVDPVVSTTAALPKNNAAVDLPDSMADAVAVYSASRPERPAGELPPAILFVVQPGERNSYDQRLIEYAAFQSGGRRTPSIRASLTELSKEAKVDDQGILTVRGHEIGLVYFRAGYSPNDYAGEAEWTARKTLEVSKAIKCPSAGMHLAGTKKVQQVLSLPGGVEHFFPDDPAAAALIRSSFAGLYSLAKGENQEKAKAMALADPLKYVLKPQREGGGNNWYGDDLVSQLKTSTPDQLEAYIVMDRIIPAPFEAIIVRDEIPTAHPSVSELGTFGAILVSTASGTDVSWSRHCGHLLRTKPANKDDGGVSAGVAVLDSPSLIG